MATGWVKSLQCKSRAFEDVYNPSLRPLNFILPSSSCRKSYQNLKDVVENTPKKPKKRHPMPPSESPSSHQVSTPKSRVRASHTRTRSETFFPSLIELPEGHSSRNVVEIIFHTSWCCPKSFPGRIEMIFKVQNLSKTVARFEEYREMVKSRAGAGSLGSRKEENVRCVADGNELMRFHCVGPTNGEFYDATGLCTFSAAKGGGIRTFPGSGGAHESAGGGKGRRAMLVCRVIAGRVCNRVESFLEGIGAVGSGGGFESVSGENGALVVFDSRALLPCFLIIYNI